MDKSQTTFVMTLTNRDLHPRQPNNFISPPDLWLTELASGGSPPADDRT
ncbi:MAG: hypothetical protein FWH20_02195 [Oscillospiraceae bacterium]|nr:hypothetical protein [Oscillospiraceae bacterium]